jgi:hypothetical protein
MISKEDACQDNPGCFGQVKLGDEIHLSMTEKYRSAVAKIFNTYGECCEYESTAQVIVALIRKAIQYPEEEFVV